MHWSKKKDHFKVAIISPSSEDNSIGLDTEQIILMGGATIPQSLTSKLLPNPPVHRV